MANVGFLKVDNFQKSVAADTTSIETLVGKAELIEDLCQCRLPRTLSGLNTVASDAIRARATLTVLHSRRRNLHVDHRWGGYLHGRGRRRSHGNHMRAAMPHGAEGTGTSVTILGAATGAEFVQREERRHLSHLRRVDRRISVHDNERGYLQTSVDFVNGSVETPVQFELMGEHQFVGGVDDNATALALKTAWTP